MLGASLLSREGVTDIRKRGEENQRMFGSLWAVATAYPGSPSCFLSHIGATKARRTPVIPVTDHTYCLKTCMTTWSVLLGIRRVWSRCVLSSSRRFGKWAPSALSACGAPRSPTLPQCGQKGAEVLRGREKPRGRSKASPTNWGTVATAWQICAGEWTQEGGSATNWAVLTDRR